MTKRKEGAKADECETAATHTWTLSVSQQMKKDKQWAAYYDLEEVTLVQR